MKGGKVSVDPAAAPPATSAVIGKWLCVSGPAVPVLLDFATDGTMHHGAAVCSPQPPTSGVSRMKLTCVPRPINTS